VGNSFARKEVGFISLFNLGQPVPDAGHKEFQFLRFQPCQELQVDFRPENSLKQFYEFVLSHSGILLNLKQYVLYRRPVLPLDYDLQSLMVS